MATPYLTSLVVCYVVSDIHHRSFWSSTGTTECGLKSTERPRDSLVFRKRFLSKHSFAELVVSLSCHQKWIFSFFWFQGIHSDIPTSLLISIQQMVHWSQIVIVIQMDKPNVITVIFFSPFSPQSRNLGFPPFQKQSTSVLLCDCHFPLQNWILGLVFISSPLFSIFPSSLPFPLPTPSTKKQ